jgi:hypothetical protein
MTNNAVRQPDERERALAAIELRVQGHPYAHIAAELGYADESGARHAVTRNLDRREAESVHELRAVHSARLEAVLLAFWPTAQGGDTDAARIVLRTLDSLGRLYGLDAPTRVAVNPPMSHTEFANEAARLIERIASLGGTDDLLRSLPDGAGQAALNARHQAAVMPVHDDDDWSNIGGPDPVPVAVGTLPNDGDGDEFGDVPDDVLDRAEAASMTIIGEYRRQRDDQGEETV